MTLANELSHCIGTNTYHRHWFSNCVYTDGVALLAERAGAYWLIDLVFSHQTNAQVGREPFQLWSIRRLPADDDRFAVVECRTDTDSPIIASQVLPYTDFPFDALGEKYEWFFSDGVMLLKSEY